MACNNHITCIDRETTDEIREKLALEISSNMLDNEPLVDGQPLHIFSAIIAGALFEFKGDLVKAYLRTDPTLKCCDEFIEWAARRNLHLKPPLQATGFIKITGNAGASIPSDIEFVGGGSHEYTLDLLYEENPTEIQPDETAVLKIRAKEPGSDANTTEDLVTLASYPQIDTPVEIIGDGIVGGADQETCEQMKARVSEILSRIVRAENKEWYKDVIGRYPGVTNVCFSQCCDPCCTGIPVIYVFMDDIYENGIPPCSVLHDIHKYVFGDPPGYGKGQAGWGTIGIIKQPQIALVDVKITSKKIINSKQQENITKIIVDYFAGDRCLDDDICLMDMTSVIQAETGACIVSIEMTGDNLVQVDSDIAFDCGHFPVLNETEFCVI